MIILTGTAVSSTFKIGKKYVLRTNRENKLYYTHCEQDSVNKLRIVNKSYKSCNYEYSLQVFSVGTFW